ncbi:hypothetical protein J6590_049934 [Homalodisca vitripennis]|nr:hypothetical protein J6590_049934 [Homalodisca vitripennis]
MSGCLSFSNELLGANSSLKFLRKALTPLTRQVAKVGYVVECDVNCHRKCEKLMPNLCGVNQKLIVEALSSLRKGKC